MEKEVKHVGKGDMHASQYSARSSRSGADLSARESRNIQKLQSSAHSNAAGVWACTLPCSSVGCPIGDDPNSTELMYDASLDTKPQNLFSPASAMFLDHKGTRGSMSHYLQPGEPNNPTSHNGTVDIATRNPVEQTPPLQTELAKTSKQSSPASRVVPPIWGASPSGSPSPPSGSQKGLRAEMRAQLASAQADVDRKRAEAEQQIADLHGKLAMAEQKVAAAAVLIDRMPDTARDSNRSHGAPLGPADDNVIAPITTGHELCL